MSIRRTIRKTHQSGAWSFAILESLGGGKATVRMGGARLTNLPCTTRNLRVGDQVIVDYSGGTPPTVIPISVLERSVSPELLLSTPKMPPEVLSPALFTSTTDIGCKLLGCSNEGADETWQNLDFTSEVWDTGSFFDPLTPDTITFNAGGIYLLNATVGFANPGNVPHMTYELRFYSADSEYALPMTTDFPVVGQSRWSEGVGPWYNSSQPKYVGLAGLGVFKVGHTMQLQVRLANHSSAAIINDDLSPALEVQLLGQILEML